jgi:MFS family permease
VVDRRTERWRISSPALRDAAGGGHILTNNPIAGVAKPTQVRHKLVGATFLLALILYLDRAALSVLAPAIRQDLGLDALELGWMFSAFVWGYALFHIPAGWLADRYGPRRVLTVIVILWSFFTAATARARTFTSLMAIRFLFGAAEAGAAPNVSRSFARWIPFGERARAQGVFFAGMSAGGALAPPLATVLLVRWGWKAAFLMLGALGAVWALGWYCWYRNDPKSHPAVNAAELELIAPAGEAPAPTAAIAWSRLLRKPNLWALLLMYFTYGYTGYIYITWFPTYLREARHLPVFLAGILASVPGVLGMAAKPLGGWWSDRLTRLRGVVLGRRLVGVCGFSVGALAVLPGIMVSNPFLAVLFLAAADAGAALAHGVCFAVCLDVGMRRAGTLSALMLTMGSLGNAASALAFGGFLEYSNSWAPPFFIAMAANLAGALLWLKIDPREQLA